MKEPMFESLIEVNKVICPWCGMATGDPVCDQSIITCEHCNEDYEVYITTTYSTYPIESEEN